MSNLAISQFIKSSVDNFECSEASSKATLKQDIQTLICDELDVDRTYLYINADKILSGDIVNSLKLKISRLESGEPLAYILGYKYFWDQKLFVTQDTLVPRADTEVIIEAVLSDIGDKKVKLEILDLGTGTGAIALALVGELSNARVIAVDYSSKTLAVAKKNAVENDLPNVEFIQSDWYESLKNTKFDVIVSNPPYIDINDGDIDKCVEAFEPAKALFSEDDGLADIITIVKGAVFHLKQKGGLYIEHGYMQAKAVREIFAQYGFCNIQTIKDLNGKDRCTKAFIL
ncbi:peptide chain release factor N(5)-glutamine methyltransferase [Francisella adeliensis]|uniref:Release factor glutamine methyltransferase n=1 Tax=Francisella adeliensis TaxID=2007306 RepID=A0A2Z4XXN6_9GAMM|nr:peptide chain release factor N(5)-glutamine methyltransferase [Francisella adeliensis]AXA33368.1 protein-(glutamine-N5) methyltransferase, release factor-specific [Francisella adeliensis]MBK2085382.1 peptide chain release factor N(5)-glutamine methyltransferase [Francisella adeliensis]MBK2097112.1 peptide chain release factor N(5)-glutamine methyltransferase [Francisella adeliensis]QIW11596.1 peptide chain release factor N(5)-glutamine methyltransferase [Francisella adeliensis]QIW13471.1 pe